MLQMSYVNPQLLLYICIVFIGLYPGCCCLGAVFRVDWPLVYGRCPVVTGGLDVLLREQIWLIRPR